MASLGNNAQTTFYKDSKWYAALLLAPIFWGLYDIFYSPLGFRNIFESAGSVFFLSVLLYPLVEEIVFRGYLQENLARWRVLQSHVCQISLANIITSAAFALSHLLYHVPAWALLTFIPSLIFGYFKDRHQHLYSCIILHSFYNFVFFSLIL